MMRKSIEMCELLSTYLTQNGISFEKKYISTKDYDGIGQDESHIACCFPLKGYTFGLHPLYLSISTFGFWDIHKPFYEIILLYYDENDKCKFLEWEIRTEELSEVMNCIEEAKNRFISEK